MSVQRAQFEIPSTEFLEWIAYLDEEEISRFNRREKEDYYLAQIAAEIRQSYVKERVKIETFLIKFEKVKELVKPKKTVEERTKKAQAFWSAVLKLTKRKK